MRNSGSRSRPAQVTFDQFINAAREGGEAGLATVRAYVQQNQHRAGFDINAVYDHGTSALIEATITGDEEIVEYLLGVEGINVNARDQFGRTALIWAALIGRMTILNRLLADESTEINATDRFGDTALSCAAIKG